MQAHFVHIARTTWIVNKNGQKTVRTVTKCDYSSCKLADNANLCENSREGGYSR